MSPVGLKRAVAKAMADAVVASTASPGKRGNTLPHAATEMSESLGPAGRANSVASGVDVGETPTTAAAASSAAAAQAATDDGSESTSVAAASAAEGAIGDARGPVGDSGLQMHGEYIKCGLAVAAEDRGKLGNMRSKQVCHTRCATAYKKRKRMNSKCKALAGAWDAMTDEERREWYKKNTAAELEPTDDRNATHSMASTSKRRPGASSNRLA